MIGLVRLESQEGCPWTTTLTSLPTPPAFQYGAFIIAIDGTTSADAFSHWWWEMRTARPHLPIGGVFSCDTTSLIDLLNREVHLWPVIHQLMLIDDRVPPALIRSIRERAVEGRILANWLTRWNIRSPEAVRVTSAVASLGATGRGVKTLARTLRSSESQIRRVLAQEGLPTPGRLLTTARIESVKIRMDLGTTEEMAVEAAGWSSSSGYARAKRRWAGIP